MDAESRWMAAMRQGDYPAAWAINDAVLARGGVPDDPRLPYHLRFVWDGRRFDNRDVLVRCYHGLGDTLQFCRFLAPLRRRAASVTLEAQPELLPLLEGLAGIDRLLPFDPAAPAPPGECDLEIMELSHALRLRPDQVEPPRLTVPNEAVSAARRRLGAAAVIGVCCRAGDWNPARSFPAQLLAPILGDLGPEVQLLRLHRDPSPTLPWANPEDTLDSTVQTASLVAAADLVISVDTMVAHLAGTLRRPVALLLKADADWRWMSDRSETPWHPTMRIFRQDRAGNWSGAISRLREQLARWLRFGHGPAAQTREPPIFTES